MKNIRHLLILAAAAASSSLTAGTIQFTSNSTTADSSENNSNGNNVVIQKNPAWANPIAGSQWISFENTGDPSSPGFQTLPNGTIVKFYQNFSLSASDTKVNGTVSLYADDSSSVVLNGFVLQPEASGVNNTYGTCSDTKPNCVALSTVVLPSADFKTGVNVLEFDVAQRAGSSFGLDYSGSAGAATSGGPTTTPEPSTWAFMATGILALGAGMRKRIKAVTSR